MPDDESSSFSAQSFSEGFKRLQELGAQLSAAGQSMAAAGARATPRSLAGPLNQYVERVMAMNTAITAPLTQMLDEQQRLVDLMADWTEQHRRFSAQLGTWAEQQRKLTERMAELARPLLEQSAFFLERLHDEWASDRDGTS